MEYCFLNFILLFNFYMWHFNNLHRLSKAKTGLSSFSTTFSVRDIAAPMEEVQKLMIQFY